MASSEGRTIPVEFNVRMAVAYQPQFIEGFVCPRRGDAGNIGKDRWKEVEEMARRRRMGR